MTTRRWALVLVAAAVALACYAAGFLLGRRSVAPKVVTKTELRTQVVTKEVVRVVEVRAKEVQRHTRTVVVEHQAPDGSSTRTTTHETDTGTKENTRTDGTENQTAVHTEDRKDVRVVAPAGKDWRVGVFGAVELRRPSGVPLDITFLVGPSAEYRIPRTPLWAGAFAGLGLSSVGSVKSGVVGLTLAAEF